MTTDATIKVLLPKPPNFLRTAEGSHPLPVSSIPDEQLRKLGEAWTEQLLDHARNKRTKPGAE